MIKQTKGTHIFVVLIALPCGTRSSVKEQCKQLLSYLSRLATYNLVLLFAGPKTLGGGSLLFLKSRMQFYSSCWNCRKKKERKEKNKKEEINDTA